MLEKHDEEKLRKSNERLRGWLMLVIMAALLAIFYVLWERFKDIEVLRWLLVIAGAALGCGLPAISGWIIDRFIDPPQ